VCERSPACLSLVARSVSALPLLEREGVIAPRRFGRPGIRAPGARRGGCIPVSLLPDPNSVSGLRRRAACTGLRDTPRASDDADRSMVELKRQMRAGIPEAPRSVTCSHCGAPAALSLAASEQRCPHCARVVAIPASVAAELAGARAIFLKLDTAARNLDAARTRVAGMEAGTLWFVVLLLLLSCGGFFGLASVWNLIDKGFEPERQVPVLGGLFMSGVVAFGAVTLHRVARRRLERAFGAVPPDPSAPGGACHLCGAALPALNRARKIARCDHCGTDNMLGKARALSRAEHERRALGEHASEMQKSIRFVRIVTMLVGFLVIGVMPAAALGTTMLLSLAFSR
jgi:DNA-directed RNA polymerase subunit RPC12/RpoP